MMPETPMEETEFKAHGKPKSHKVKVNRFWDTGDLISDEDARKLESAEGYNPPPVDPKDYKKALEKSQKWYRDNKGKLEGLYGKGQTKGDSTHGLFLKMLEDIIDPKNFTVPVDWKSKLRRFLKSLNSFKFVNDFRGRDLSREYFVKKRTVPSFYANGLPSVIYVVDNSGSMGCQGISAEEMRMQICVDIWELDHKCNVDNSALCNFCGGDLHPEDIVTWDKRTPKKNVWTKITAMRPAGGTEISNTLSNIVSSDIFCKTKGQYPLLVLLSDCGVYSGELINLSKDLNVALKASKNPAVRSLKAKDILQRLVVVMLREGLEDDIKNIRTNGVPDDVLGVQSLIPQGTPKDQIIYVDTLTIKAELEKNR